MKVSDFTPPPPETDQGPFHKAGIVLIIGAVLGIFVSPFWFCLLFFAALIGVFKANGDRQSN